MKIFKIVLLAGVVLLTGVATAHAADLSSEGLWPQGGNCTTVIVDNYDTRCIDGYEWLVKYEKFGCQASVVPVAQKLEIYPKKSGKPKMVIPVQCSEINN